MTSANPQVQDFLDALSETRHSHFAIIQQLRDLILSQFPDIQERIMYGGIMLSLSQDFGGIFAYQNHVTFEFGKGASFDDPKHQLAGTGKHRRHLKFHSVSDINPSQFLFFLNQAISHQNQ